MSEQQPIALFKSVVSEERWLQNAWQDHRDGKDYLCLAAAWGKPGQINGVEDCPTNLFPRWLFEIMPALDDGIPASDVPWLFKGFAERADGMAKLSPEAWERIRTGFMIGLVRQAVDAATPVQPDPKADHWVQLLAAVDQVAAALESGDPGQLKQAEAAAWAAEAAAEAAAWAAEAAAEAAARAAARAAAEAAARAAEAAARAAARAAAEAAAEAAAWAAAWAAEAAAEAAAYRSTAELLFKLIDAEIHAPEPQKVAA